MSRNYNLYLQDIVAATDHITSYTEKGETSNLIPQSDGAHI